MRKVRYATEDDIFRLVELAKEEHALSAWASLPFDAASTAASMREFIEGFNRTMLITDGGYLAGVLQPLAFHVKHLVAMEYAWFANDGSGQSLIAAFERWAQNMSAVAVVANDHRPDTRLRRVLVARRGYEQLGASLVKKLEHAAWQ